MRKLLLQLDTSPHPSVFDRIVAIDGGADDVMSYGGVTEEQVRDLVHGTIFTRGLKHLHNTAIFIGGTHVPRAERLLAAAMQTFFGPLRVSVMFDPNGANTTAAAAVAKLEAAIGSLKGCRAVVTAGTGPVGVRAVAMLALAGADVTLTSRMPAPHVAEAIRRRFHVDVTDAVLTDPGGSRRLLVGADIVLNAGPAGVPMVSAAAWQGNPTIRAVADLNAVPPLGVEGIEAVDDGVSRNGPVSFGALGIGGLKMKVHKASIARLFQRNDAVLDAETIAEAAREIAGVG